MGWKVSYFHPSPADVSRHSRLFSQFIMWLVDCSNDQSTSQIISRPNRCLVNLIIKYRTRVNTYKDCMDGFGRFYQVQNLNVLFKQSYSAISSFHYKRQAMADDGPVFQSITKLQSYSFCYINPLNTDPICLHWNIDRCAVIPYTKDSSLLTNQSWSHPKCIIVQNNGYITTHVDL